MIKEKMRYKFSKIWDFKRQLFLKSDYRKWKRNNCPSPPPHLYKQNEISKYQNRYNYETFIETGTFLGDMVSSQKDNFQSIISIELSKTLYEYSKKRFCTNDKVKIINGDSGQVLKKVLAEFIDKPAIFWLDGHFSNGITAKGEKECPILEELNAIFNSRPLDHVILIDDARCFTGSGDYPSIEAVTNKIKSYNKKYTLEIQHDIMRFTI